MVSVSSRKKINIAVVGYGAIARSHVLGMASANIRMNLPFEMNLSHIVFWGKQERPYNNVKMCSSLDEVINDKESPVDIIDIANINEAHFDAINKAAEAGIPIYCEKPLTESSRKSHDAYRLIEEKKIINRVPFIYRYLPCIHLLKEELKKNTLGRVIRFDAHIYHCSYLDEMKRKSWRSISNSGGGAVIDLSIHMLDLIRFIFGELCDVKTETSIYFPNVINDEMAVTKIRTESKILGEIKASRVFKQRHQENTLAVYCEQGSFYCDFSNPYELEVNFFEGNIQYIKMNNQEISKYVLPENVSGNFHQDAHTACISDMVHEVFDGTCSGFGATARDAYLAQKYLDNRILNDGS